MRYHMSDIFCKKDLSDMDENYNLFMAAKNNYIKNPSTDNYIELASEYLSMESGLKEMMSINYLTKEEFLHIRKKIKEGIWLIFNEHIIKTKYNGYGGSERKMAVIMDDNNQYLLKFPDPIRDKDKTLSYINNSISEYISCHIFDIVGIPVQETKLGEYIDQNGKTKIVCACKDVREPYEDLWF